MLEDFKRDVEKVSEKSNDVLKEMYDLGQINVINALFEYCEYFGKEYVPIDILTSVKSKIESEMNK